MYSLLHRNGSPTLCSKEIKKMDIQDNQMKFFQIAMKYLPEAQQQLNQAGIELTMDTVQPLMSLFTKVMNEAYELGKAEALAKEQ
jgi:competence protein ComZ